LNNNNKKKAIKENKCRVVSKGYKKTKTYLVNKKKQKKTHRSSSNSNSRSESDFEDLLSQGSNSSRSSEFSDGLGSLHPDLINLNNNTNTNNVNNTNNPNNTNTYLMDWEPLVDLDKYNLELNLDDETCPLPEEKVQDKYADYEAYDIFKLYFTDELLNHVVDSTNEYLQKERSTLRFVTIRKEGKENYADLTVNEFKVFLGMKIYFNFFNNNRCQGNIFKI